MVEVAIIHKSSWMFWPKFFDNTFPPFNTKGWIIQTRCSEGLISWKYVFWTKRTNFWNQNWQPPFRCWLGVEKAYMLLHPTQFANRQAFQRDANYRCTKDRLFGTFKKILKNMKLVLPYLKVKRASINCVIQCAFQDRTYLDSKISTHARNLVL